MGPELRAGRWLLGSRLGSGGMAEVFEAQSAAGEVAAVKLLRSEVALDQQLLGRFWREVRVAGEIGHPALVPVIDHGIAEDGRPFIAMELLHGRDLAELARGPDGIPLPRLLGYADQLLDALAAAHAKGIVHRDLKPANLFVMDTGQLRVLDFGIARLMEPTGDGVRTATGVAIGTVSYMAPEQAAGKRSEVDERADLFAVGAILFRLLSGERVHEASAQTELLLLMATRPARSLASVAPDVPQSVVAVVDRALAFDKHDRFPDARAMQAALRAAAQGAEAWAASVAEPPQAVPTAVTTTSATATARDETKLSPGQAPGSAPERFAPTVAEPHQPVPAMMSEPQLPLLQPAPPPAPPVPLPPVAAPHSPAAQPPRMRSRFPWGGVAVAVACFGVAVFAVMVAGMVAMMGGDDGSDDRKYKPVNLKAMLDAYRQGTRAAREPYISADLETSGTVRQVGVGPLYPGITLGDQTGPWLYCETKQKPPVSVGATVTVRGHVTGWDEESRWVLVAPCEVVR